MIRITFGVPNNMVKQFDREDVGRFPELSGLCEVPDYGKWPGAPLVGLDRGRPGRQGQRFP
jgi:hypothetical protein